MSASRTLNAEALRSVMLAYDQAKSSTLRTFADTLYNSMWAKTGTCVTSPCVEDGDYITSWDSGGWYIQDPPGGTPWDNRWHKYFGMSWGIGASSSWPAVRGTVAASGGTSISGSVSITGRISIQ